MAIYKQHNHYSGKPTGEYRTNEESMKLKAKSVDYFKKGEAYHQDIVHDFPSEYFRKPISKEEDPSYPEGLDGREYDTSDLNIWIKSFRIETKIYE